MRNKDIFFSDISEIGVAKQPVSNTPTKLSRGAKVDEIRDIKDIAKAVREYVKKKYPNCKFSVSIDRFAGGQSMTVSLQQADFNPLIYDSLWSLSGDGNKYFSVNQYHFEKSDKLTPEAISVLKDVRDFYNQFNYNHSDPSTDYSNVRFYETLTIGQWDKGFVQVGKKSKTPKTPRPAPEKGGSQPKYAVGTKVSYKTSRGSEDGKVLGAKLIASKDSYLYEIENPRGGTYRVWESNIISGDEMPELPTPEIPKTEFTPERLESLRILQDGFPNSEVGSVPLLQDKNGDYWYVKNVTEKQAQFISATGDKETILYTPANAEILFDFQILDYIPNGSKKLKKIVVQWSENSGFEDGEVFYTWYDFQQKAKTLNIPYGGYDKTKVFILWENNRALIDRVDIGDSEGDFNPKRSENGDFIGEYIGNQSSAMYWSNFTSGKRKTEAYWYDDYFEEEKTPTPETPEPKYSFKVGDVFRRNMEGEEPPNTKITYTILSINEEKSQYRIDYLDGGTNRLSTKSNEKITDEITSGWWIPYEAVKEENNSLKEAISQLKDENDLMWDMYVSSEDTTLRKELRETSNGNGLIINDFTADLTFDPQKFMDKYFDRATEKFAYDNSELSKEEFDKIVNSEEFINWFGDFRKPLQDALCSKVVKLDLSDDKSATREPLIVYHGTWNKAHFSRFKFSKFPVIYFATNKSYAEWFAKIGAGIMYQCFLDIKFLCDFRPLGVSSITWEELSNFLKEQYGLILPQKDTQGARLPAWAWIRNDAPDFALINTIKEQGFTGMAHVEDNPQDILPNGEKNVTTAYMIFSPEQAKLVRYISTGNAFTDIFFMKKGGKVKSALLERIKNLKV